MIINVRKKTSTVYLKKQNNNNKTVQRHCLYGLSKIVKLKKNVAFTFRDIFL